MEINIVNFKVEDNPINEVKSRNPFKKKVKIIDANGNFRFDQEGIFSEKIFGRFYSCTCGKTKITGTWCPDCGCRVISGNNIPDFYISLGIPVPVSNIDYKVFGRMHSENVENIMTYKSFVYEGKVYKQDLKNNVSSGPKNIPGSKNDEEVNEGFIDKDILIGKDALLSLKIPGLDEEWYNNNTIVNVPIPHPCFRPLIFNGTKYIPTEINDHLVRLIDIKNKIKSFEPYLNNSNYNKLVLCRKMCEQYLILMDNIFGIISNGNRKCIHKKEIIGQNITGAIRSVLTNDDSIEDEDVIIIGKEFIRTLFPHLYKKYRYDIDAINKEILERDYFVLVDRNPTIGPLSIIAMRPVFTDDDDKRFIIGMNSIVYDGMAADTDGDVLFVAALYSRDANQEAKKLLPSRNYMNVSDGTIRNKIPEDYMFTYQMIKKYDDPIYHKIQDILDGRDLEDITRKEYMQIYNLLKSCHWKYCKTPTIGDIVDLMSGKENETINNITGYLQNKESFLSFLEKDNEVYENEESDKFMNEVISSNTTEISEAGYFYKKLMSSTDDIRIIEDDCESEGVEFNFDDIDINTYLFKIRFSYITELNCFARMNYNDFCKKINEMGLKKIHVRNPISCKHAHRRRLCSKCVGEMKRSYNDFWIPKNIGIYSTLMITEHATQASLDSMNKGVSKNMNVVLDEKIENNRMEWDDVVESINALVDRIGKGKVQARFYQIALISRFYRNPNGKYFNKTFAFSMHSQKDPLGLFIYQPTQENFKKLIRQGKFESDSIKTQIMFDMYD